MKRTQQLQEVLTARCPSSQYPSRRRRGSTLLEFALIVPILVVMLLGIIEFGWLVKNHLTIANATREGARAASLGKTSEEIQDRIKNAAKPAVVTDTDITLTRSIDQGSTYPFTLGDDNSATPPQNDAKPGDLINVKVKVNHAALTNLPFMNGKVIDVSVAMIREK